MTYTSALEALKDAAEPYALRTVGGLHANPTLYAAWIAADELQHPEKYAPPPVEEVEP